jgi:hypothetical protein
MSRLLSRSAKVMGVVLAVSLVAYLGLRLYGPVKGVYDRYQSPMTSTRHHGG